MKWTKKMKGAGKRAAVTVTALGMVLTAFPPIPAKAAGEFAGKLTSVESVKKGNADNIVIVTFNGGVEAKLTFLEDGIFRYNVDPSGEFSEYAKPRQSFHKGRIQQYPDSSSEYSKPEAKIKDADGKFMITSGTVSVEFDKETAKMKILSNDKVVMEETEALSISKSATVQTLKKNDGENFYGGGCQNGRFVHTGESINIANESNWTNGGVSSPNPFYITTEGYGVLRNTFADGKYDFGKTTADAVTATHNEGELDAYYFVSDGKNVTEKTQELLREYYHVSGNPTLLPEYAFYEGHLNAYNRDAWSNTPTNGAKAWTIKGNDSSDSEGKTTYEIGRSADFVPVDGQQLESLNGKAPTVATEKYPNVTTPEEFSARAVLDDYVEYDMPLGYFLPNDGYGSGYGQNGHHMTGGVNSDGTSSKERLDAVAANIQNLAEFTEYAQGKGIQTGLWTQSYLVPDSNSGTLWHRLRDFENEVKVGGISTLKTDVAWVSQGYSMQLDGVKSAYDIATTKGKIRPNIISLDGWAGSQRYCGIWTGDQYGGEWEYIRFHIPTYLGMALSGIPNLGSDMDGIFGGSPIIATRDYQWKSFSPLMLNMDGWGTYAKMPYVFGDPYTGLNRMYMKIKAQMLPYIYTGAASGSNIDTGNGDTGLPLVRAMFLEYPNDSYANSKAVQYQYMFGSDLLVAPIYQNTADTENTGNDIRNNIYLPGEEDVWIDYFTGEQYQGGQVLNNFDAPLWKLPLFVKNGAIIPMWEENNSPEEIDKANRIVEFWPSGKNSYTMFEDDGKFVENNLTEDKEYGQITDVSYGNHVSTKFTSEVKDGTATLTAEKSTGDYTGYKKDKNTTFVVNVSKKPTKVTAKNGSNTLEVEEVQNKADFDTKKVEAGKAVYFYDESPVIETYASEKETAVAELVKDVKRTPKLYVKFAQADAKAVDQTLVIEGFANDGKLPKDQLNENLAVPTLTENVDAKTPTSITLGWNKVDTATSYELMIDEVVFAVGDANAYTHVDLTYHSEHTYQVRSRNADGYSKWSEKQTFQSAEDPWKDTPTPQTITWSGEIYGNHKADLAFDKVFQQGDSGFHSNGNSIGQTLTVDYGKAYEIDKIEYYPRTDASNGTVKKMKLETSLDGVHWTEAKEYTWERNAETKVMGDLNCGARYIRFTPLESVGNFFAASEIKVYKKENTGAFAVGSTNKADTVSDGDYTNMKNYLGTCEKDSLFVDQIKSRYGDINMNNIYDVYDYAFTMFQLDGGTKKTDSVSGEAMLLASSADVKKGETFTIDVYAQNVAGLNAFGQVINYDPKKVEFVSCEGSPLLAQMENLTVNKVYDDGAYVNLAYANRGDKNLYAGSDVLATITMKAKDDISTENKNVIDLSKVTLIGPNYSTIESEVNTDVEIPDVPATEKKFAQNDFNITMTNEKLTEDSADDPNVNKLIQQNNYNGLFDGTFGRDFEFKWDISSNHVDGKLPDYIILPTTMHLALKNPEALNKVVVSNANKGNGYLTSVSAKLIYTDDTASDEIKFEAEQEKYTFEFSGDKAVKEVQITFLDAKSTSDVKNMLTLAELELSNLSNTPVTGITADPNNVKEMYVGTLADINATVQPDNATNKFFTAESSNEDVVKILTLADENGYPVYKARAMKEGKSTITLAAAGNKDVKATYEITVKAGVDISGLNEALAKARNHQSSAYTEESYGQLTAAVNAATELLKGEYTKNQVLEAQMAIYDAIDGLVFRPLDETKLLDAKAEGFTVTATSECDPDKLEDGLATNVLDGKEDNYWHTEYNKDVLPQSLNFDLGGLYNLTDITFLARQGVTNGDILKAQIFVGSAKDDMKSVGTYEFDEEGNVLVNRDQYQQIAFDAKDVRYVEFKVLEAGAQDKFASMAEIRFYGERTTAALKALYDSYVAENLNKADYTADSWAVYEAKMDEAKALIEAKDTTNAAAGEALTALQTAHDTLAKDETPTPGEADKTALKALCDQADALKSDDYTADSWAEFLLALREAKSVLGDETVTQDVVNQAVTDLQVAIEALVKNDPEPGDVDKSGLQNLYNQYKDTKPDGYTESSWLDFAAALDKAEKVLKDEKATVGDVQAAVAELEKAYKSLEKEEPTPGKPDKSGLQNLYNQYKDIKADGYTKDSWTAFDKARTEAEKVLTNEKATQAEIDAAKAALQAAYEGLAKDTTPEPEPQPNPNPTPGGNGGNSGNGSNTAVVTGDSANIAGYLMMLLAAGGIAAVTFFRRKRVK